MRNTVLILLTFLYVPLLFAQEEKRNTAASHKFTLEECINFALENNFDQRSLGITKELREVIYNQSKKERLLDLSASASQSISYSNNTSESSWGGSYSLGTNVTLFGGGTITNTIKQNKINLTQSQTQIIQAQNTLSISIIQAYLSVLMNDELLKYQKEVLKSSLEQVNQGKAQYQANKIIESDLLLLESQYASDKYNEVNTTINRDNAILKLKNLLSLSSATELVIIPIDTNIMSKLSTIPELNYVVERSLEWSPDMEITRQNIEISNLNTKIAKAGFYPTLSVGASIGTGYNRGGGTFGTQLNKSLSEQAGLSLSIPIYNKGKVKSSVVQSQGRERQAQLEAEKIKLSITQQIEQDYQTVRANYAQYEASQIKQSAYKESFRTYGEQFNAGSITAADLLIQQNSYLSAVSDLLQSKYSFILNRKILDVYMGINIEL